MSISSETTDTYTSDTDSENNSLVVNIRSDAEETIKRKPGRPKMINKPIKEKP